MGDHRASVKIEFEFHGVRDSCDMWINWSPDTSDCRDVDQRVIDFFRRVYEKGMDVYYEEMAQIAQRDHQKRIEKIERRQLAELQEKYKEG